MDIDLIRFLFLVFLIGCNQQSTLVDADGNHYSIKKYGKTTWMTENLRVKLDKSGNPIQYYFPSDDSLNTQNFGLLYDYETACKACPNGWRLPTNEEWNQLFQLPESNLAGNYKDNRYWQGEKNSNSSLFSIRPAGSGNNGEYENHFNAKTLFWSNTKEDEHFVWTYILEKGKDSIRVASQHPTYAISVRCVKINP